MNDDSVQSFMNKIKKMEKGEKLDLSSDEDLSIAVMNLISIEEHLFFTAEKTGRASYYDMLLEVREMRKQLLKLLVKDYEGEGWCISKHLLATSMRLMEVGTKALTKGDKKQAQDFFKKSYDVYNLFWGINLGLVSKKGIKKDMAFPQTEQPAIKNEKSLFGSVSGIVGKLLDCCRE